MTIPTTFFWMTMQLYIGNRAQIVKNYETENYITTTVWLAQSIDLNIIENIWLKIKQDLQYDVSGEILVCLMVFNATFNNISVISWR